MLQMTLATTNSEINSLKFEMHKVFPMSCKSDKQVSVSDLQFLSDNFLHLKLNVHSNLYSLPFIEINIPAFLVF